jgi:hypothetical protein
VGKRYKGKAGREQNERQSTTKSPTEIFFHAFRQ